MNRQLLMDKVSEAHGIRKAAKRLGSMARDILTEADIDYMEWILQPDGKNFNVTGFYVTSSGLKHVFASVDFSTNCCRLEYKRGAVTKVDLYIIKKAFLSIGVDWFPYDYMCLPNQDLVAKTFLPVESAWSKFNEH